MDLAGKVTVVTGGASGIGRALCRRFRAGGAEVVVSDLDAAGTVAVAEEIGGLAVTADVATEADVVHLVDAATDAYGRVDLFCANAGIFAAPPFEPGVPIGLDATDEQWQAMFQVNFLSHVYAARALIPRFLEQGGGHLLVTVSAAGLLTSIGNAPYAVTKHAALGLAEWLAITYGDAGVGVSVLCPLGVRTAMIDVAGGQFGEGAIEPEEAAETVVEGLADGRFLILPHPEVADFFSRKAGDYDRWLRGMRRLQAQAPPPWGL
jgi:NAD(P)-dependent dehydrogenase (short-subunit alcohol dehydrogenase family)